MKFVMKFAKIIYKCMLERFKKEVKTTIASKKQL